MPFYADRSDHVCIALGQCDPKITLKKKPSEYLKQLYFDSLVFTSEAIRHLALQVGADRIVLGSDYPYLWQPRPVDHILGCKSLSQKEKIEILGSTAARLLRIAK